MHTSLSGNEGTSTPSNQHAKPPRPPSDASSRVVLSGLPNWQRRPKPPSTHTTTTASQSISTSGNRTKPGNVHSGKRQRQRTGEGMGMQSTPAKKRKTKSIASIGNMSTPKTQSKAHAPKPDNDSTDSPSTSVTTISTSDPPISSADESLTSPSLSLSVSTIDAEPTIPSPSNDISYSSRTTGRQTRSNRTTTDTVGRTSLSTRTVGRSDVVDDEMSVPLNDLTSISTQAGSSGQNSHKSTSTIKDSSGEQTIMQAKDLTVPLNDFSSSTNANDTDSTPGRKKVSKPPSKISSRQTTPYRLPPSLAPPPLDSDSSSSFVVNHDGSEQSLEMARGANSPSPPYLPAAISVSRKFPARIRRDTPETPSPLKRVVDHDLTTTTLDGDLTPERVRNLGEPARKTLWDDQSDHSANEGLFDWPDDEYDCRRTIRSSSRINEDENVGDSEVIREGDPFGFLAMNRIIRASGRIPQEWYPSSQEGSPRLCHSPSPISFTSTLSTSSSPDASSAASSLAPSPRNVKSSRVRGVRGWRGAKVLARMEGRASPCISVSRDSADESEQRTEEEATCQDEGTIHTTQLSEDGKRAREARIAHYKDIEENWHLKVEYVWC